MKHTKGKWTISQHDDNNDIVVRGEDKQIVANCTVDFYGGHPQGEEIQANARLIAAAPDLLAACEKAEIAIYAAINKRPAELSIVHHNLKQVITKAIQ